MAETIRGTETKFIRFDKHLCQACWKCSEVCPQRVFGKVTLFFHKHSRIDNATACKGCLKCAKACPAGAIEPKTLKVKGI
jgi:2-oxoglutarate ferredoxin oxidoreductase subunit delta